MAGDDDIISSLVKGTKSMLSSETILIEAIPIGIVACNPSIASGATPVKLREVVAIIKSRKICTAV